MPRSKKNPKRLSVCTLNVNGIRAGHRKGFFDWLARRGPDVACLQEIKAHEHQLSEEILSPPGYEGYFFAAEKPGYSGVAIYSRLPPRQVIKGLGPGWADFDAEGRYLQIDFPGLSVVSLYLPSGSSGEDRQRAKYDFMERFVPVLRAIRRKRREFVLCGDWNIAHRAIDLKNWRANQKNSGFLPEERTWMDQLFGRLGFVDAFRAVDTSPEQYTWWSNRGRAWAKNVGWRIDYQVITPGLRGAVEDAEIYKGERFSDHAPLIIDYGLELSA